MFTAKGQIIENSHRHTTDLIGYIIETGDPLLHHSLVACRIVPCCLGARIGDYVSIAVAVYRSMQYGQPPDI